jgi:predicted Zn-dependent protease
MIARWLVALLPFVVSAAPEPDVVDRAVNRIYNADFAGANAILDGQIHAHPSDPLLYSVRGASILFSEFDRMKILEIDFFSDDDRVTDRKRVQPNPAVRAQLFKTTTEARTRARHLLAADPNDRNAMFALGMAAGLEFEYTIMVEKRYLRSYTLARECQQHARKLLAMNPPVHDAYLTVGSGEYLVGSLNPFFRLFVRIDGIEGNKQKGIENLKKVIAGGRVYPPWAKILLSLFYLREHQPGQSLALLQELQRDFPENPLIRKEVAQLSEQIARSNGPGR